MMDDEARWSAVMARDRSVARAFVYAVRTTGIYCVPSCPSRRPKRKNVVFFDGFREALAAGYRACRRCDPDAQHDTALELVRDVCRFVLACEQPPSLQQMAAFAEISPSHLHRVFKLRVGRTPRGFAADVRAERARASLGAGATVTEALHAAGFGSASRFYAAVDEALGMAPTRYRNGGEGVEIQVALATSSLGTVLVGATAVGVCAVALGEDAEALLVDVRRRFARASFVPSDDVFERRVAQVVAVVDGISPVVELPLDIRGTAFQHQVWRALTKIPAGGTATYAGIAEAIGRPSAARAVAAACATNELALLIPCHRVLASDGTLRGYRWGLERKRILLARERDAD